MSKISIISKQSHQTINQTDANEVSLTESSLVVLKINPNDVAKITRSGNAAVITLKNGETIVVDHFFNDKNTTDNTLVFEDDQGKVAWAEFSDANGAVTDTIKYHYVDSVDALLSSDHEGLAALILPWAAGAAVIGGIAAAADSGGSSSNPGDKTPPPIPTVTENNSNGIGGTGEPGSKVIITDKDGNTVTTIVDPSGHWHIGPENPLEEGEKGTIEATDPAGNGSGKGEVIGGDQTAPTKPVIDPVNGKDPITGTAEPDSTVTVTYPDGKTATVHVDSTGHWEVPNPGLKDGDEIKANATDPAGNKGDDATAVVDGIPPNKPVIDPVNGKDPITGTAEPDSTVTVTYPDGKTATVHVDSTGHWEVPNPGLKDGDEIKANATDPAGNKGDDATAVVDGIPPNKPVIDPVNVKDPITGTAEPDSTVTVTYPDGKTATVHVDSTGHWEVPNPGLKDGDEIKANATDPAGNKGDDATAIVDAIPPSKPIVTENNGDGIGGTGEPGSEVIITDKDGNTVTTTVDPSGNWHIGPENPLEEGEKGTIEAKDPAGNTSGKDPIVGGDQTPPSKPIVTENNGDGIGGTGEPGSKVIITDKDGNTVTTTVDPSGNWHIGPENPLEEGEKGTIEAKDPAGNTSGKDPIVGGDQTPPPIPVVTENNANGLGGTGEPGSKVTITDKDGNTVTTTVDPSGHWHVGPNPLEEGEKGTIEAKDAAGNSSEKGPVIGGDQTAPDAPEINPINLVDPITGTAEPNSEVVVKFPNGTTTTVQADDKGNWSVPNPGLKDGDEVSATATDKAGNTSVPGTEIVDGIPPKAPIVNPVNGHDPITGTSEPGATIHVKFPDGTTVTTTVDASGNWSVPNPGLADKSQIIVNATDPAGNKSPDVLATVDAFAAAPTIALANDTGTSKTDGITSDGTVKVSGLETRAKWEYSLDGGKTWKTGAGTTFIIPEGKYDAGKILVKQTDIAGNTSTNASLGPVTIDKTVPNVPVINTTGEHTPIVGSAEAGSIVKVTYPDGKGGTTTVSTTADASGNWTVPNPGLKDGDTVTATATDEAGNVSQPGQTTIDGTAPATPAAPTEYLDNTDPQQGTFGTGTSTNDTTPGLIIPAPAAGETPKLYVDGTEVPATYDPATGTLTPNAPLGEGKHDLTYTLTDAAGNESGQSPALTLTVDTQAPNTPVVNPANEHDPITGTGEPGSTITVSYPDGQGGTTTVTTTADASGNWTVPNPGLKDGDTVTATATDEAGNVSQPGQTTIDGTAPATPAAPTEYLDNTDPQQGTFGTGTSTNDTTPGLIIPAPAAGETPKLYVDGTEVPATYDPATGTLTPNAPLGEGKHDLTYTLTDAAGNESAPSAPLTLTVDTQAPNTPVVNPANEHDPITGTGEPGSTITVSYPDGQGGTTTVTTTADASGNWTVPNPGLKDGDTVTATATDEAGNVSQPGQTTIDGTAPATPAAPTEYLDNTDPQQGTFGTGTSTNDTTPGLIIPAPAAGETPKLYVDGTEVPATYDPATGTLTPNAPLGEGKHDLTYTLTDAAGNESGQSPALTLTVDTQAPNTPVVNPANEHDPITGTGEPGSTITVSYPDGQGGTTTVTTTADASGNWTVPNPGLKDGDTVTATATDEAGNVSQPGQTTIDGTAPATPAAPTEYLDNTDPQQGTFGTGTSTNDTTPGLIIPAPAAGETPKLYVDGTEVPATYDPATGTLTPNAPLGEGKYDLTYSLTDAAGNESGQSPALTLTVDTQAPNTPVVNPANEHDPITGTGEPGSTITVSYPDGQGGTTTVTTTADASGNWTVPNPGLKDGDTVTATATDEAGNVSQPGQTTIDGTAPATPAAPTEYLDNTDPQQGTFGTGTSTNDTTPGLIIPAPAAGETPKLYVDGTEVPATYDPATGTLTPNAPLGEGKHDLTYTLTDAAGNESAPSAPLTLTVDTQAPNTPVVNPANEHDPITGTGEPGSTITVSYPDGQGGTTTVTTTADASGNWTVPNPGLKDGDTVTATATDEAGNVSQPGQTTIDGTAPATPAAPTEYLDNTDPQQGTFGTGTSTNDTTPGLIIPAPAAGETPKLYVDGTEVPATYDPATGTLTPNAPLGEGKHDLTYTLTDAAGNESGQSPALTLTVDTQAPNTPVVNPANEHDPITGTGEPGSTITVSYPDGQGGTTTVTTTADASGNWTVPNPGLKDGDTVTATATDEAGNVSQPGQTTIDGTAPATPAAPTEYLDNTDPQQGTFGTGTSTNDTTPGLIIPAPAAGETPKLYVDGTEVPATYDPATGTLTPNAPLGEGKHDLTYTLTDAAGNESGQSPALTLTVDTQAPNTPVVNPANEHDPITGTGEPGSTITVSYPDGQGGTTTVTTTADASGNWTVPNPGLKDGDTVTATATDEAGNVSQPGQTTIDGTAPATPAAPTEYLDNTDPQQGTFGTGTSTNDTTPGLIIPAPAAGETPKLYVDGAEVPATYDPATGTLTPNAPLGEGKHDLTYTLTDATGNESGQSPALTLTVDTQAPNTPVVNPANEHDPITGTGEPGSTITVSYPDGQGGTTTVTTTADASGNWTVPNPGLKDGDTVTATATDEAGNVSQPGQTTIDGTAPATPAAPTEYLDNTDPQQGTFGTGTSTNDTTPGLIIPAPAAGETPKLYVDGTEVPATYDPATGTLTPNAPLGEGKHDLTYTLTDAAGNESAPSAPLTLTVDTQAPNTPVVNPANEHDPITGTGEPGSTITVSYPDGQGGTTTVTTTADASGNWTVPNPGLKDGDTVTATATDEAGNVSQPGQTTIDGTAPATPAAPTEYLDNTDPQQGTFGTGTSTNDTTPGLIIPAPAAGETPKLYVDGTEVPATYDPATGTLTPNAPLGEGKHDLTYTLTDAAGNESGQSPALTLTVDTQAPNTPVVNPANEHDPITGTGEPGSTITVSYPDGQGGTTTVTTTADASGNWTVPNPGLKDGDTVTATATDEAGNVSQPGQTTIDGTAPATPAAPTEYLDNTDPQQGTFGTGTSTNDTTPGLIIPAPAAGETPKLYVDGTEVPATYDPATGTLTPNAPLGEGKHDLTYTLTDAAGNESAPSAPLTLTVDTQAPNTPVVNPANEHDPITGTGEPGSTITVSYPDGQGGTTTVTTTADASGNWTVPNPGLKDGDTVTATATDEAGNVSQPGQTTIDGTAPATPAAPTEYLDNTDPQQGTFGTGTSTNDTTPGLIIPAPAAGETPKLYVDGTEVPATYDPATGTLTPNAPLGEGKHDLTYTLTDAAGNESAASGPLTLTVDTQAPNTPVVNPANEHDPITGTGEPGSTITVSYPDGQGGTTTVTTTADASGNWTVPNPGLKDGDTVTATATDEAGNVSQPGQTTIDGTAPATPAAPTEYLDNTDPQQGTFGTGTSTNDTTPGLIIPAPAAGETPKLYVDGTEVPATYDPATGTLTPTTALTEGQHDLTYTLTDAAGNESAPSGPLTLTVDTTAPDAPAAPTEYLDNTDPVQGTFGTGTSTNDTTPGLIIPAPAAGETPKLYVDGTEVPATYDPATGTLTPNAPLSEGKHDLTYTLTDEAGNESGQSGPLTLTVDTIAPDAPTAPTEYLDNTDPVQGTFGTGTSTNDTTPGLIIPAPAAGETPKLYVDGTEVPATYDPATGTLTPTTALTEGKHDLTYTLTDAVGNESAPSGALTLTVDTQAPDAPTAALVSDTGIPGDGVTSNGEVAVTLTDSGVDNWQYSTDGGVTWSTVQTADNNRFTLADGDYPAGQVQVREVDPAGNISNAYEMGHLQVYNGAPPQPQAALVNDTGVDDNDQITTDGTLQITGILPGFTWKYSLDGGTTFVDGSSDNLLVLPAGTYDNVMIFQVNDIGNTGPVWNTGEIEVVAPITLGLSLAADTGSSATDGITSNGTINVTGISNSPSSSPWEYSTDGGTTWTPGSGTSFTLPSDGTYAADQIQVRQSNPAFTSDSITKFGNVVLDNSAPDAPVILNVSAADVVTGTAEKNSVVTVKFADNTTEIVTVSSTGTWSVTHPGIVNGSTITATATDTAGNVSQEASKVVDTSAPATPTGYVDNVAPEEGTFGTGTSTNDTTPGLIIPTPAAGETPKLYVDGTEVPATYDPVTGTLTPTTPLTEGQHDLSYTLTDSNGFEGIPSAPLSLTVDTQAPTTPATAPTGYVDNVAPEEGTFASGTSTNDTTPGLIIPAPAAGETPKLYVDGTEVPATYDPATGTLTPTTPLTEGQHDLTYSLTDAAGNESGQSPALTLTVDTQAPNAPAAPTEYLDNTDPQQGTFGTGTSTNDSTPGVIIPTPGTGETPKLYVDGTEVPATYDPATGTLTPTTPLTEGKHDLTYTLTDEAGNESDPSPAITITVDTQAPTTPAAPTEYLDNTDPQQGQFASGTTTNDTTPGLIIPAPAAGETPKLYVDGTEVPATYDPATGTLTPTTPLTEGKHDLTYTLTDAAGNESDPSPAITITVDTQAPATPAAPTQYLDNTDPQQGTFGTGTSTNDTTPGLIIPAPGTGETPKLYVDGTEVPATYDPATGTLTPTTALTEGQHDLTYTLTDAAGNESAQSPALSLTVDTQAPTAPAAPTQYVDDAGTVTGQFGTGTSTDDTTPGLIIPAPAAGETPKLYVDGTEVPATYDPATGTLTPTTPLGEGKHDLTYTLTDEAGNESGQSGPLTLTVDTIAPDAPAAPTEYLDNTDPQQGQFASGTTTNDTTPGLIIAAPGAGETPKLYVDGTEVPATYDPATGTLTPTTPLTEGKHDLTYTLTDAVGNESAPSGALTLTVDTQAPDAPTAALVSDTGIPGDGVTSNGEVAVTLTDSGVDNWQYSTDGGVTWSTVQTADNNRFTLADGDYPAGQVQVREVDPAGNISNAYEMGHLQVYNGAPPQPQAALVNDTGVDNNDQITTDGTLQITGILPGFTWKYSLDGGTTFVDGSSDNLLVLPAGTYDNVMIFQVNDIGNTGPVWNTGEIEVVAPITLGLSLAADTGSSATDGITSNGTINVTGINQSASTETWEYSTDGGTTWTAGSGTSFTLPSDGTYATDQIQVRQSNPALDAPSVSKLGEVVVLDTQLPTAPEILNVSAADVVTGTAEKNSVVTVKFADNTTEIVTVSSTGTWSVTHPGIVNGSTITATATDTAGNVSPEASKVVDTSAPATPTGYVDNVAPEEGTFASGTSTNDTTPGLIIPTPAAGETPKLYVDGTEVPATYDPVTGTLTPTTPLTEGQHDLSYTLTDSNGFEGIPSAPLSLTVDTQAPTTPATAPTGYVDNVAPEEGTFASGTSTNDTTPGLIIPAPAAGETPKLYVDGTEVPATYDPATGTLTPTTPLTEGQHDLTYSLTDAAGNESGQSPALTLTVDTQAPTAPAAPTEYLDNTDPQQGTFGTGTSTNDSTPGVIIPTPGTGETPKLYVDGTEVPATYDPATGTLTPTTPLTEGQHDLTYTLTDEAGNESDPSPAITVTVDTQAPTAPAAPTEYLDNTDPQQGTFGTGTSTNDSTPGVIILVPAAGETPKLYVDGTEVPATYDPATGTLTPTTPLTEGQHDLTYSLTDAAGNESDPSPAITITVDTQAPATPAAPTQYLDNTDPQQGTFGTGTSTNDTTPGLIIPAPGTGETPKLYVDGTEVPATYDPATGTLTPTTALTEGQHDLTYTLTDAAGNESVQSPVLSLTVDTQAPNTPAAPTQYVDDAGTVTGQFGTGTSTDDTTPGLIIAAPGAGETPKLYVDGTEVPATYDPATGTLTPNAPLGEGKHDLTYTLTDAAGNESNPSPALTLTVDTQAPTTPAAPTEYLDNTDPQQGQFASGTTTNDTTPGLIIAAPGAGETPKLYVDGTEVPATYDPATGTLTPNAPLGEGKHDLTYTLTDAVGNESAPSGALTLTVDTQAPDAPTAALVSDTGIPGDGVTSNGEVAVTLTDSGVDNWQYSTDGGVTWSTVQTADNNRFTLADGDYPAGQVQVREVDPAGNVSDAYSLGHLQVYNGAPPQPQAALVNDTGVDNNDQITTDGTLQITGILPGFTWKYSLDGGTTFVDGSSDNLLVLPAGTYDNVMIFQVNDIGSSGTAWNTGEIEVVAPITLGLSLAADTGSSTTDGITSNGTINVTGINQSASTGTWEYSTDGGTTWTPGSGTSFTLPSDGTYAADQIQVRQSNPALDAPSVSKLGEAVVIDTQLPTAPEILNVSAADVVTGTAEKNSVVTVKFADNTTEIVTVSSTGTWSVTHPGIVNGSTITATATDTAGNISPEASKVVDNSAPATPTGYVDNVAPEEGTFASGTSTNDTTPGVLIAAPAAGETPKLYVDGTEVPATYDPVTGTLTPDAPLGEGKHDLTYTLTDSNGFESVPSGILSLTVDTQTPVAPTAALVSDTGIPGDGVTSYGEVAVTLTDSGIDNWQYSTDGGVTWSTVQTADNNRFTLADGDYPAGQVQVREVDPAGNASDAYLLGHLQVYNGAPPQPQAYLVNDTGADDNDQITTDGTLQITGILPGFTWSYSIDDGPFITGSSDNLLVLPIGTYDNIMISQVNDIGSSGQAWNTGRIEVVASDSGSVVAPFAAFSALEDTTLSNTTETSTSANDTFNSTASQHNTVIFNVLNNADATGGNGQDTWNGFTVTPTDASSTVQSTQDVIDVTKLLSGQSVDATNISKFVTSVTVNNTEGGKDTVIAIDRDGAGGSFNSTDILTLKNVDTTVDELIKNHQLLY